MATEEMLNLIQLVNINLAAVSIIFLIWCAEIESKKKQLVYNILARVGHPLLAVKIVSGVYLPYFNWNYAPFVSTVSHQLSELLLIIIMVELFRYVYVLFPPLEPNHVRIFELIISIVWLFLCGGRLLKGLLYDDNKDVHWAAQWNRTGTPIWYVFIGTIVLFEAIAIPYKFFKFAKTKQRENKAAYDNLKSRLHRCKIIIARALATLVLAFGMYIPYTALPSETLIEKEFVREFGLLNSPFLPILLYHISAGFDSVIAMQFVSFNQPTETAMIAHQNYHDKNIAIVK
jgi:hypothetical protein